MVVEENAQPTVVGDLPGDGGAGGAGGGAGGAAAVVDAGILLIYRCVFFLAVCLALVLTLFLDIASQYLLGWFIRCVNFVLACCSNSCFVAVPCSLRACAYPCPTAFWIIVWAALLGA